MFVLKTQATTQVASKGKSVYRKTPGDFGPAFIRDLLVGGHVETGQGLVDLQTSKRKKRDGYLS